MPEQLENWWQAKSTYIAGANVLGGSLLILSHIVLMGFGLDKAVEKLDKSLLGLGTGVALISVGSALFASRGTQERIIKQNDTMIRQGKEASIEVKQVAKEVAKEAAKVALTESGLASKESPEKGR